MKYLAIVRETNLPYLFWLSRRGNEIYVLDIAPFLPVLRSPVRKIVERWIGKGVLHEVDRICPNGEKFWRRRTRYSWIGWERKSQATLENLILKGAERDFGQPYQYVSLKQTVCYGGDQILTLLKFADFVKGDLPDEKIGIVGADPVAETLARIVRAGTGGLVFRSPRFPAVAINFVTTAIVIASTLCRVARFVRLRRPPEKQYLIGVDMWSTTPEDTPMALRPVERLCAADDPAVLCVFRNRRDYLARKDFTGGVPCAPFPDGRYTLAGGMRTAAELTGDAFRLYRKHRGLFPALFFEIVKTVAVRAYYRGLINKYRFRFFLGRDEYDANHIIRTEELRRAGGISMGIINGTSGLGPNRVFMYVDFDISYVVSEGPLRKLYTGKWRNIDSLKLVGTTGLPEGRLALVDRPRSPDFACFTSPHSDGTRFIDEVSKVARAFPDRMFRIGYKGNTFRLGGREEFDEAMARAPDNVIDEEGRNSFDLILRSRYVLCSQSTILAESIELKSIAFFLDVYDGEVVSLFRDYPGINVTRGEQIVEKIKAYEAGTWAYPYEQLSDLCNLSGRSFYDHIYEDLGIAERV